MHARRAALIGQQALQIASERLAGDVYGVITAFFFALYFLGVGEGAALPVGSAGAGDFRASAGW